MLKEMVDASWGKPNGIKRTVSSGKISEQWTYGVDVSKRTILYFENGILNNWQY